MLLAAKRLELMRQLVPRVASVSVLVNQANPSAMETTLKDVEAAARHGTASPSSTSQHRC